MKNKWEVFEQTALKRAIDFSGGITNLARAVEVTPQAVHGWLAKNRVPSTRVLAVEAATEKEVTREELRPDLYPPV